MTASSPFTCVLDVRASLGECPLWADDERVLYWVDINAPSLNRFDPESGRNTVMPMPSSIGSFCFREGGGFAVALRDGIWLADARGELERKAASAPYDPSTYRFNDGRCDRQGRFVVGSMNEQHDPDGAALYRLDASFALTRLFGGMTISNGLGWSPDGATMYHADTPMRTVRAYDYDRGEALPANGRVFAQWHGETERPDGGAVDSAGNYWIAFYRGGKVLQLSPRGETIAEFAVPAMCPTMCAFGGVDFRTLYVTTARQKREADELARLPQSGGIFAMRVDVPGMPEPRFRGWRDPRAMKPDRRS
jgi:sugar lactone lactonase YvrE